MHATLARSGPPKIDLRVCVGIFCAACMYVGGVGRSEKIADVWKSQPSLNDFDAGALRSGGNFWLSPVTGLSSQICWPRPGPPRAPRRRRVARPSAKRGVYLRREIALECGLRACPAAGQRPAAAARTEGVDRRRLAARRCCPAPRPPERLRSRCAHRTTQPTSVRGAFGAAGGWRVLIGHLGYVSRLRRARGAHWSSIAGLVLFACTSRPRLARFLTPFSAWPHGGADDRHSEDRRRQIIHGW